MLLVLLLLILLLPGVAAALATAGFEPHPSLASMRYLLTGMALTSIGLLVVSLGHEWWIVDGYEPGTPAGADSPHVLMVASAGLVSAVLTMTAAWGRRNWAFLALTVAWLLLVISRMTAAGEWAEGDAGGEALSGLDLATWSIALTTVTAVIGSLGRLAERRARRVRPVGQVQPAATDAGSGAHPEHTRLNLSTRDVGAAVVITGIAVLTVLGVLPHRIGWLLVVALLVWAGARLRNRLTSAATAETATGRGTRA